MTTGEPLDKGNKPSRRQFLLRGTLGTSLFGWGALVGAASSAPRTPAAAPGTVRPVLGKEFAYNITPLTRTDPALVQYAESKPIPTGLNELRGIVVGPDRLVYAAGDQTIRVFDRAGTRQKDIPLDEPPRCLAVGGDGNLFVAMKDHVEVLGPSAPAPARWNSLGPKTVLTAIAVTEKDVFVADAGNRMVLRFDRDGRLVNRIGAKDATRNVPGFVVPSAYFDLNVGPDGLLWVANPGEHRLEAYTFEGGFVTSWGQVANTIEGFCGCCNPVFFARLPAGGFVTSEKGLARIKVYSAQGRFEAVVAGCEAFPRYLLNPGLKRAGLDVDVDATGNVLASDPLAGAIRVFRRLNPA